MKKNHLILTAVLIVALLMPLIASPVFLMKVLAFVLFACAFNLLLGFGGMISFGHAAFFGAGSYFFAHAVKEWGFPLEVAIPLAMLIGAVLGALFGMIAVRRQGIYLAMITLALAQLVYFTLLQAPFTHGEDGIQGVPRATLTGLDLSSDFLLYYVVLAIVVIALTLIYRVSQSPYGQVMKAIRDNERRAISLGYRVNRYKVALFALSATFSSLAGALKVLVLQLASLSDAHWSLSGEVILMALLGGLHYVFAPAIGAALVITMQNYLSSLGPWVSFVQGLIFVVCVVLFDKGIASIFVRHKQP